MMQSKADSTYSEDQRKWVFWAMIFVGGFYGAYTYSVRGGVFCNAQTANMVLFSMALGNGNMMRAASLLIPFTAYFLGTMLSELLNRKMSQTMWMHWSTVLVGIEILAVLFLGLLPPSVPDGICQVTLNFICSMQFNTFRKNEGLPMATTFITNHVRETGSYLVRFLLDRDKVSRHHSIAHGMMLIMFSLGALVSTVCCIFFHTRAIFCVLPVLIYVFIRLLCSNKHEAQTMSA